MGTDLPSDDQDIELHRLRLRTRYAALYDYTRSLEVADALDAIAERLEQFRVVADVATLDVALAVIITNADAERRRAALTRRTPHESSP